MAHGKNYEKVKRYYGMGVWTKKMVCNAVAKGWITPEDYKELTGEEFQEIAGEEEA